MNLAIIGYGKMGRLIEQLAPEYGFAILLRLNGSNNAGATGITAENLAGVDVALDFSAASAVVQNVQRLAELGINTVVGATGWNKQLKQVEEIVRKSGVKEGMVLVSAMHITAGIYVNDNESGLIEDIDQWLEHLAPFRKNYKHHDTGEDNGDSHLKALLIHHEVIVPITAGKLDLGTWQRIFYAEFDGQRDKRVIVKVMGE